MSLLKELSSVVHHNAPAGLLQMARLVSLRLSSVGQEAATRPDSRVQTARPEISLREVAQHDSIDDCWMVIYDRVYDVTEFLSSHPGGHDVMLEYAGRDASMAFRSCGHSDFAIGSLVAYEIGELPPAERMFRCAGKMLISDLPA